MDNIFPKGEALVAVAPRDNQTELSRSALAPVKHSFFPKLALLTLVVFLVHGYHPLADDGAVYVAGIEKLANPDLFRADAVFALSPTRISVFAHLLAPAVRWRPGSLPWLLLACHLASIFLFLLGCRLVALRLFPTRSFWGAVLLAAACFTLPVAGTSLSIMDPYVTARAFTTPFSLFALAAALEQRWRRTAAWLFAAGLFHPLMAFYSSAGILTVALVERGRWRILATLCGSVFVTSALIFMATLHPDPRVAYNQAALSRSYYFLSTWRWYEYPGLLLPLLLLFLAALRMQPPQPARSLALAATITGASALLLSVCFVHRSGSLLLGRAQPLRAFQFVYLAGVLLAGGLLGRLAATYKGTVAALYAALFLLMFAGQRAAYPDSSHVEWPGMNTRNQWQQAFVWIRTHTPANAVFALDNHYIESPGEDAQGFRATAERSAVADYYKDGGIASNFPQAARLWWPGSQATAGLNQASDQERRNRLRPFGVAWIVLPVQFATGFPCPFINPGVRVCRLDAK